MAYKNCPFYYYFVSSYDTILHLKVQFCERNYVFPADNSITSTLNKIKVTTSKLNNAIITHTHNICPNFLISCYFYSYFLV